jgi:hypothetical protein
MCCRCSYAMAVPATWPRQHPRFPGMCIAPAWGAWLPPVHFPDRRRRRSAGDTRIKPQGKLCQLMAVLSMGAGLPGRTRLETGDGRPETGGRRLETGGRTRTDTDCTDEQETGDRRPEEEHGRTRTARTARTATASHSRDQIRNRKHEIRNQPQCSKTGNDQNAERPSCGLGVLAQGV